MHGTNHVRHQFQGFDNQSHRKEAESAGKYWETIADNLSKAGLELGLCLSD